MLGSDLGRQSSAMARENGDTTGRGETWKKQVDDIKKIFDFKEVLGTWVHTVFVWVHLVGLSDSPVISIRACVCLQTGCWESLRWPYCARGQRSNGLEMCMSADSWTAFYILLLCCYYCSLLADACRSSVVAQRGALITSVDFVLWHRCVIKHRVLLIMTL